MTGDGQGTQRVPKAELKQLIREVIALGAERLDDEQGASFEEEDTRPAGEPVGEERESLVFTNHWFTIESKVRTVFLCNISGNQAARQ